MGEEVKIGGYGGGDERVMDWEEGLPDADDLTPLSQALIPPELASAFRISPEPARTMLDVNLASQSTFSSLSSSNNFNFKQLHEEQSKEVDEDLDPDPEPDPTSDSRKSRRIESSGGGAAAAEEADSAAKTMKRPRLVWTPQLHKRFVDVVAHLGIKNAVPKTIMQLMNVEGLTRENVASHLQKYRLYLKRMQGLSNEGPSSSDHLFASTPVPQSLHESAGNGHSHNHSHSSNGHIPMPMPMPMPYPPHMMPMPMIGMGHNGHVSIPMGNPNGGGSSNGFHHHQYNMMQQRDWSANRYGTAYHHVAPADK